MNLRSFAVNADVLMPVTIGSALYSSELELRLPRIPGYYPELRTIPVKGFLSISPPVLSRAVVQQHVLAMRSLW